jgi:hypothetical protein
VIDPNGHLIVLLRALFPDLWFSINAAGRWVARKPDGTVHATAAHAPGLLDALLDADPAAVERMLRVLPDDEQTGTTQPPRPDDLVLLLLTKPRTAARTDSSESAAPRDETCVRFVLRFQRAHVLWLVTGALFAFASAAFLAMFRRRRSHPRDALSGGALRRSR